jgi:threonine dehydratase
MVNLEPVPLEAVYAAKKRIAGKTLRTPLIRLNLEESPAEIYLKLENLQPAGSFKVRGAVNALLCASKEKLSRGISTVSSGNLGFALTWYAKQLGISCTAVVPEKTSEAKLVPLKEAGGKVVKVPYEEWFKIVNTSDFEELNGYFIHPEYNPDMMAGHGTIALEVLEDLPDVDAMILPYGGGSLSCSVSSVFRTLKPDTKTYVSEVETGAPVAAALAAGAPVDVEQKPTPFHWVGATRVLTPMWPLVRKFIDGSIIVTVKEVAEALRLLAGKNYVIAEGSGAMPVAAARTGKAGSGKIVCVVTGGNIDVDKLVKILTGEIS